MRLKKLNNPLPVVDGPDFPSLLEETAKPRPGVGSWVAAFAVSRKYIHLSYIDFIYKKIVVCKV